MLKPIPRWVRICPSPHTYIHTYIHKYIDATIQLYLLWICDFSNTLSRYLLAQFTWCPATGCERIVRCQGPHACGVDVQCDCGHEFCFMCHKVILRRAVAETVAKACTTTTCKRVCNHLRSNCKCNFWGVNISIGLALCALFQVPTCMHPLAETTCSSTL